MRLLEFIIKGQSIKRNTRCNFGNIVKGTRGYLKCVFSFDSDWDGCRKLAKFEVYTPGNQPNKQSKKTYMPIIGTMCDFPDDFTNESTIRVSVIGTRGEEYCITTDHVEVRQI